MAWNTGEILKKCYNTGTCKTVLVELDGQPLAGEIADVVIALRPIEPRFVPYHA